MPTYENAVALLKDPSRWEEATRLLTELGDTRAVVPLLDAYELPVEGGDKLCLAEALKFLLDVSVLDALAKAKDPHERRAAARLRRLFAKPEYIDALERALDDESPLVRHEARLALAAQHQNERWERAMAKMLDAPDGEGRELARNRLLKRRTASARAILEAAASKGPHP